MSRQQQRFRGLLWTVVLAGLCTGMSGAQMRPTPVAGPGPTAEEMGATQQKLLEQLRTSPNLSVVVAGDPSLLANQEYVSRNNPELADFLKTHPEVARNPAYYLFADLHRPGQPSYEVLTPREGFQTHSHPPDGDETEMIIREGGPFLALILIGGAVLWLIRLLLENRRWSRAFRLQSEVHGKLIDKLGNSQELFNYMETEAGKRFLEAAPITTEVNSQRVPNVVSRVLTTLQAGLVMMLLGAGLLMVRYSLDGGRKTLLVLGIVVLMPGVGFTLSAGITWILSRKLGLMPVPAGSSETSSLERL